MADLREALSFALLNTDVTRPFQEDAERKERERQLRERERRYALDDYDRTGRWDTGVLGAAPSDGERVDTGKLNEEDRVAVRSGLRGLDAAASAIPGFHMGLDKAFGPAIEDAGKTDRWKPGPDGLKYDYTKTAEYADIKKLADQRREAARESFNFAKAATKSNPGVDFGTARDQFVAGRGETYLREQAGRNAEQEGKTRQAAAYQQAVRMGVFGVAANKGSEALAEHNPEALDTAIAAWREEQDPDTALRRASQRANIASIASRIPNEREEAEAALVSQRAQTLVTSALRQTHGDREAAYDMALRAVSGTPSSSFATSDRLAGRVSAEVNRLFGKDFMKDSGEGGGQVSQVEIAKLQRLLFDIENSPNMSDDEKERASQEARLRAQEAIAGGAQ